MPSIRVRSSCRFGFADEPPAPPVEPTTDSAIATAPGLIELEGSGLRVRFSGPVDTAALRLGSATLDGEIDPWCAAAAGVADHGGGKASLINTAKMHRLDSQTYLADVLDRIVSGRTKVNALSELLPWHWKAARTAPEAAAA